MSLHGQVVIVTGASRGLGAAVAQRLAAESAHLVLAARDGDALEAIASALSRTGTAPGQQVIAQQTDVAHRDEVERLVDSASRLTGRIDVLVSNAGVYGPLGPIEDVDWDAWVE